MKQNVQAIKSTATDRLDRVIDLDDKRTVMWLFVGPAVVLLALLTAYPFVKLFYDSFFEFNQAGDYVQFVEISNYVSVLTDSFFTGAIVFTVMFVVVVVSFEFILGMIVAVTLQSSFIKRRYRQLLVILSVPPMMVSPVITGLTWRMLLEPSNGPVNALFGLNIGWLGTRPWAAIAVFITDIWMWTPLFVLVIASTLQAIPGILYEAADVDGMSKWQQFKWITFPEIKTAVTVVLLLRVVMAFKVFPQVFVLTGGGPGDYTQTLAMSTYAYGFRFFELGNASAAGIVYLAIMLLSAYIIFKTAAKGMVQEEEY